MNEPKEEPLEVYRPSWITVLITIALAIGMIAIAQMYHVTEAPTLRSSTGNQG